MGLHAVSRLETYLGLAFLTAADVACSNDGTFSGSTGGGGVDGGGGGFSGSNGYSGGGLSANLGGGS